MINKTATDIAGDAVVGLGVNAVVKALQALGVAADAATIPSGEGAIAAAALQAGGEAVKKLLQRNVDWYAGVAWRGADFTVYDNEETILNFSGAEFRIDGGRRPRRVWPSVLRLPLEQSAALITPAGGGPSDSAALPGLGEVSEAGEPALEAQGDRADRPVPLLADDDLGAAV